MVQRFRNLSTRPTMPATKTDPAGSWKKLSSTFTFVIVRRGQWKVTRAIEFSRINVETVRDPTAKNPQYLYDNRVHLMMPYNATKFHLPQVRVSEPTGLRSSLFKIISQICIDWILTRNLPSRISLYESRHRGILPPAYGSTAWVMQVFARDLKPWW